FQSNRSGIEGAMRGLRPTRFVALTAFALLAGCQAPGTLVSPTLEDGKITARGATPDLSDAPALKDWPELALGSDAVTELRKKATANPELRWVASQTVPGITDSAT